MNINITSFGICNGPGSGNIGMGNISLAPEVLGEDGLPIQGETDGGVITGNRCMASIPSGTWENTHYETQITDEGKFALTTNSFLKCKHGGIIRVKTSGQEITQKEVTQSIAKDETDQNKEAPLKSLTPEEAITLGGTLAGMSDTALGLDAFLHSGFSIRQSGNYMIINGSRLGRANVPGAQSILGTRYRIGSNAFNSSALSLYMTPEQLAMSSSTQIASRYVSNLGKATQLQFGITGGTVSQQLRSGAANLGKSAFGFSGKSFLDKFGTGLGYAGAAYGGFSSWQENIVEGETKNSDVASDVTVEVGAGLANMAVATGCAKLGAAVGTAIPIPVVGTAVGAVVGFGLGWLGGWAFNEFVATDEAKEWVSEGIEEGIDGAFSEEDME